jgi:hypothetical protein
MTEKDMIWTTGEDPETTANDDSIARNVELRYDETTRCTEIRVTRQTLYDDQISLPKLLEPLVAIKLGIALIDEARKQIEAELYE